MTTNRSSFDQIEQINQIDQLDRLDQILISFESAADQWIPSIWVHPCQLKRKIADFNDFRNEVQPVVNSFVSSWPPLRKRVSIEIRLLAPNPQPPKVMPMGIATDHH
ncbi:hypothetical protein H6G52_00510 [Limnothrix sp. FACHB-881]|uniref:hypothetical protein n=1 Tax=Limnothrix sp. FACHB-881 TaxID=2692819 RepID=UPI0016837CA0|nr:hypothetical protein [Limnothrix sp. FACHB-881]MBD2633829.1 hypothetical protein [Limnothrix sp. FACHB-881]